MTQPMLRRSILIVLGALLWQQHATAQTVRYVDNNLTSCADLLPCYPKVMDAVDASAPADVIEVFAGVYVEPIILSGKGGLVLKAHDEAQKPVIVAPPGAGQAIFVEVGSVQVLNFIIEAPSAHAISTLGGGASGIVIQGNVIKAGDIYLWQSGGTIRDNTILGSGINIPSIGNNCLIEGNRLIDAGIAIGGSDSVGGNVIRSNDLLRGSIELGSGRGVKSNVIESNRLYGGGRIRIGGSRVSGNVIRQNVVRAGGSIGFWGDVTGNTIESNVVSGSLGDGIWVGPISGSPGGGNHVHGNTSVENGGCDLHDYGGGLLKDDWSENRFVTGCGDVTPAQGNGTPPTAVVSASATTVECSSPSGGSVTLNGSGSQDPDSTPGTNDDIVAFEWFENYGLPAQILLGTGKSLTDVLPLGSHPVSLKVTDSKGASATSEVVIQVVDTTAPSLSLTMNPSVLWPPDHKMVPVAAAWRASDACDPAPRVSLVSATSSEPDAAAILQDAPSGSPGATILLRAERSGNGPGRVYTLTYTATDASGNRSPAVGVVTVPHKM
jgi:hypothetical protein